ncbi:MAG: hypothetical protein WD598_16695 [Acidimicrobiia bacterium]
MTDRYRRRYGVIFRRGNLGGPPDGDPRIGPVNDGGRDAPMGPRDQTFFKHFFWVAAVIAVGLIVWILVE